MRALFWISAALIVWTQAAYAPALALLRRIKGNPPTAPGADITPSVTLIVAAYNEEAVIAAKVANARALDYPDLEVIVAVDGGDEGTVAGAEGADQVLALPRTGKYRAQDAAVQRARGEIVAFSDANTLWEPAALRTLVRAFADPAVGYACGQVTFVNDAGTNQEGLYWRYEMFLRAQESALASVTGGNGAIYAVRRAAYERVDPTMGHDLAMPFQMVKAGFRAVYVPEARATEKMVPSIEGEWARKRRMMSYGWPIVLKGGLLHPRGYSPLYALMIVSHRLLRYGTPLLHVLLALATVALLRRGGVYTAAAAAQAALAAAAASRRKAKPVLVARYYVLTTAALALGLYDWLRHGTQVGWEIAEGTR
ncbi:cellulose synthase/poly-beta-1,6-N-acetylglucosamine synthase-like glycosyltransferase [Solirubrobacter pauli]|uniref:Cellulose synthase/poly-beta-1,6-N-acetylglucosamine synthase-like glycosyltransferase n=1 Tax=Solirubrobacter pauli TaxID=166793 RepID=A0A660LDI6_9ACTN|nr:glycosyltransferase [Solirubrobacter pauli]RKQ92326.1 cellulose synthase/poly-beta-1,6-N-acetylglucosamine synthase-like glycosyltransferase [Solirubrobacter pauli]